MGRDINSHLEGSMGNKRASRPRTSPRARVTSTALALGALATAAVFGTGVAAASPHAKAARTLTLSDSARLHLQNKHGLVLKEAGNAKGTLGGALYLQLNVTSTRSVTAQIQVYPTKGGSISGSARASYRVEGSFARFSGTMSVTKGSGTYSKAKASSLSFSGTIQRSNDAVTVRVSGKMSY
jgi:hypothetical protein